MNNLKDRQYYIDLYDLLTIERCLRIFDTPHKDHPNVSMEGKTKAINLVNDIGLYYLKIEEFENKAKTIEEWIQRDKILDEKVDNAVPPEVVRCSFCSSKMELTMKHLDSKDERVMFWFECPACKKRKAIFDDGAEFQPKPSICPKCSSETDRTHKRDGEVLTTKTTCPNCKYESEEIMDFKKDDEEWEEKQKRDRELLKKYRHKFCLSEEEGNKQVHEKIQLKITMDHLQAITKKTEDPRYNKAKKLKMLKFVQLKSLVEKAISKTGYEDLAFDKPEIDRYVVVGFSVNDTKDERGEYDSKNELKKLVQSTLKYTNWRLMSEGISYRLGFLTGSLKAYEREEDLVKIV